MRLAKSRPQLGAAAGMYKRNSKPLGAPGPVFQNRNGARIRRRKGPPCEFQEPKDTLGRIEIRRGWDDPTLDLRLPLEGIDPGTLGEVAQVYCARQFLIERGEDFSSAILEMATPSPGLSRAPIGRERLRQVRTERRERCRMQQTPVRGGKMVGNFLENAMTNRNRLGVALSSS